MITEKTIFKGKKLLSSEGKITDIREQYVRGSKKSMFIKFENTYSDFSTTTDELWELGYYIHGFKSLRGCEIVNVWLYPVEYRTG
jgi:hypothetical protein